MQWTLLTTKKRNYAIKSPKMPRYSGHPKKTIVLCYIEILLASSLMTNDELEIIKIKKTYEAKTKSVDGFINKFLRIFLPCFLFKHKSLVQIFVLFLWCITAKAIAHFGRAYRNERLFFGTGGKSQNRNNLQSI